MIRYLKAQVEEIRTQSQLQIYGFFIGLLHAVTLLMLVSQQALSLYDIPSENICWPFFPSCQSIPFLTSDLMKVVLLFYGALILATMGAFILKRVTTAFVLMTTLLLLKFGLISLSYHFSSSVHLLSQIVLLCWLFVPGKNDLVRLVMVASSVVFGLLKLNQEWLTGAALPEPASWTSASLLTFLYAAPLIEVIAALGLLSKVRAIQGASLFVLAAWHFISIKFLGVYGPVMMVGLLSVFLLNVILWEHGRQQFVDLIFASKLRRSHLIVLGAFVFFQVLPLFVTRYPTLSSVPSMLSLRLPPHRVDCSAMIQYQDERGRRVQSSPFDLESKGLLRCDPLVYLNQMKKLCDQQSISDARLVLFSKPRTAQNYALTLDIANACERSGLVWAEVTR